MGVPLDHALSAFLEDLEARGLSDKILLVACGEMGRTPRINKQRRPRPLGQPGAAAARRRRPAHGPGASAAPTANGGEPASDRRSASTNLIATILHTLFDVGELRLVPGMPREIAQTMTGWEPIDGLV